VRLFRYPPAYSKHVPVIWHAFCPGYSLRHYKQVYSPVLLSQRLLLRYWKSLVQLKMTLRTMNHLELISGIDVTQEVSGQPTIDLFEQWWSVTISLPGYQLNQNSSSEDRVKHSDVRHALVSLHWLRVPERIVHKITVQTCKVLHGIASEYLGPNVRVADSLVDKYFRSAGTNRLVYQVPPFKLSTIGTRAFPVAGPHVWNSLPADITSTPSLSTFRQRIKTYLFRQSFPHLTV